MLNTLIKAFSVLPGVGDKSATRFVYYLLEHRNQAQKLAKALQSTLENIKNCKQCRTLTEKNYCNICDNPKRNNYQLCIVENPTSITSIESSGAYYGKYFVLGGYISPIDNIGSEELKLSQLKNLVEKGNIEEIILATNASIEGEVTNHYIKNMFMDGKIKITHLARGIPLGGELEYTDINTIARALTDRF